MYKTNSQQTMDFLSKKTERISVALYMVTSLLSDAEPLKWELRTQSLNLRSGLYAVQYNGGSFAPNVFQEKKGIAKELLALLEVGRLSQIISEMNVNILSREIAALITLFEELSDAKETIRDVVLDETFFAVSETPRIPEKKPEPVSELKLDTQAPVEGYIKDTKVGKETEDVFYSRTTARRDSGYPPATPQTLPPVPSLVPVRKPEKLPRGFNGGAKDARKDAIIKALRKRPGVTIKDITDVVPGYSEKTIQRELIALIKDNLVERRGERRWSRYWLAP